MKNEHRWLQYYKNSLFDSENLAIDITRIKNVYQQNNSDLSIPLLHAKNATSLVELEEKRINRVRGVSNKKGVNWITIQDTEILIAPFTLWYESDNIAYKKRKHHPFWIRARVDRAGQLSPPKEVFPLIARNYLTPIADVKNEFIFASLDNVISANSKTKPDSSEDDETVSWDTYWQYVQEVFKEVSFFSIQNYTHEKYITKHELTYFAVSAKVATAKSILFLYDVILETAEELPLLSKLVEIQNRERRAPVKDQGFLNFNHLHLGQMSDKFPLSISQRKSLLSYLTAEEHPIIAVNGPPGTGKTTLLQSVVASEFVKAAVRGEDAPIILACSNNNQAVTNIIHSFLNSKSSLKALADRWIPDFKGYATYLPSNSKREEALKTINYLKGNLFGHEGTLCTMENNTYLKKAEAFFLMQFNRHYQKEEEDLEEACLYIQNEIISIEKKLLDGVRFATDISNALGFLNARLVHHKDHLQKDSFPIGTLQDWKVILTRLKSAWKDTDFIRKVGGYFTVNNVSNDRSKIFTIEATVLEDKTLCISYVQQVLANVTALLQANLKLKNWKFENNIVGSPFVSEDQILDFEYEKVKNKITSTPYFFDEIDLSLRHEAFLLATHYWEARWILATQNSLEDASEKGTGEKAISLKWKRRAMLTPCFVGTFYTAPSHFIYSQFQGESEEGKPIFEYFSLLNFLDLLIIDEAGQVTPEVSIPVFSMAKKAFVVGDLKQIEPIWSIPSKIDAGNLNSLGLTSEILPFKNLEDMGFLVSNGSIMRMAQNACEYHIDINTRKENGLILLEHRRCNDEIINFCNELAYDGILKPMKGTADASQIFPSMLAYHVVGLSERKYSSRFNISEVNAIVLWLQQHKEAIQKAYNVVRIEEVLGIITPFASQKTELSKALSKAGYDVGAIKLGTVHALQGAERNIILFSSVYSKQDEGTLFFDRENKPNMLNVAVSRAKDSFILFGDMQVFDASKNTPSGLLKRHLTIRDSMV